MNDDLPNSDVADQFHDDLLVKRLTNSDNTGFSNGLEKRTSLDRDRNRLLGGFFYSLVSTAIKLDSPPVGFENTQLMRYVSNRRLPLAA